MSHTYQCFLFAANAERALLDLREDDGRLAAAGIFVVIQVRAVEFLEKAMSRIDYRRLWIERRFTSMPLTREFVGKNILRQASNAENEG